MKFKNYKNSYTNDNRIYSYKDISEMPLGEVLKRKNELIAQNRVLGVPTTTELQQSENVIWVQAYTRDDGTKVCAHWRSKPDGILSNNLLSQNPSIMENQDNKTTANTPKKFVVERNNLGKINNEVSIGDASEKNHTKETFSSFPDSISGVKRGQEKTFEDIVNSGGINPSYDITAPLGIYDGNCNSCVAAYLYNRFGYPVKAASTLNNKKAMELSQNGLDLWIDPKTNQIAKWTEINTGIISSFDYLNKNINVGEIYELAVYPQMVENAPETIGGHVIVVEKGSDNKLKIYDPQERLPYTDKKQVEMFLDSWIDNPEVIKDIKPKVIRIDNKRINPYYEDVLVH